MIIGIISDTHLSSRNRHLPNHVLEGLQGGDLILHAGDFCDWWVYEKLSELAPVEAVAGNNDGSEIVERLGLQKIIEAGGKRIGLVHGDGWKGTTPDRAFNTFPNEAVDIIVFGHSHTPLSEVREDILLFNPGSPTDKRREPRYSYGKITIEGDQVSAEHFFFDKE